MAEYIPKRFRGGDLRKLPMLSKSALSQSLIGILESKEQQFLDELEKTLIIICEDLMAKAVEFRLNAPGAHNFTGNLINSIVINLYRDGKLVKQTTPSDVYDIRGPIRAMMSAPRKYFFKEDWEGEKSRYFPQVAVGKGLWGNQKFRYRSSKRNIFEILVVYTAPYAEWVEMERQTTGFAQMSEYVKSFDWHMSVPF